MEWCYYALKLILFFLEHIQHICPTHSTYPVFEPFSGFKYIVACLCNELKIENDFPGKEQQLHCTGHEPIHSESSGDN